MATTDVSVYSYYVSDIFYQSPRGIPYIMGSPTDGVEIAGGNVFKSGTPKNNEVAIWSGDGVIRGDSSLLWDNDNLDVSEGNIRVHGDQFRVEINEGGSIDFHKNWQTIAGWYRGITWYGDTNEEHLGIYAGGADASSVDYIFIGDIANKIIVINKAGSVELNYSGDKKLETTNTGITVTGLIDGSISKYETKTNLDASFALYETIVNIDTSISNILLGELSDVSITGVQDGSSLIYEADGAFWTYGTGGGAGSTTLVALTDTSIGSNNADIDFLRYVVDVSMWENIAPLDASEYFQKKIAYGTTASGADGTPGDWTYDASYLYVCTSTNFWIRVVGEQDY